MERRTIDLDGPVHYLEWEGPGHGPTFVLVHGLGGSHANWLSFAPLIAARGRVLVPDLAGFGKTPLAGRTATVQANRALLDRFIEATGATPAILVGNSMGGLISLMQAHAAPERVAGLVLVDPACPRVARAPVDRTVAATFAAYLVPGVGERYVEWRYRKLGPERIVRETLAMCCVDPSRVASEVVEAGIAIARERATYPWAVTAFLQAARSVMRFLARRERHVRIVREVAAPALLVMGRQDRLVQIAAADALARVRPDWEYVVFDDLGHVPQMEDPQGLMRAVDSWLAGPAARLLAGGASV